MVRVEGRSFPGVVQLEFHLPILIGLGMCVVFSSGEIQKLVTVNKGRNDGSGIVGSDRRPLNQTVKVETLPRRFSMVRLLITHRTDNLRERGTVAKRAE